MNNIQLLNLDDDIENNTWMKKTNEEQKIPKVKDSEDIKQNNTQA